jgi:hypothetical protein
MSEVYYDDRSWISRNHWRIAFVVALLVALGVWQIYIAYNDDGYIRGRVTTETGRPVAGAQVELQEETINLLKPPIIETTDDDGRFEYQDIEMIEFVIRARKEGVGVSERQRHHLYFMGQNWTLPEPLVLRPAER